MSEGLELLPQDANVSTWSEQQKALMSAAGLVVTKNVKNPSGRWEKRTVEADRPTVEAFLLQCRRTGLDPFARQIYCIERAGRWTTSISIDGFRLIAERSGDYAGQTEPEFTADGVTWTTVWLADGPPRAARVGVLRRGFTQPMYATATWSGYCPRDREGAEKPTGQWVHNAPLMLAKCAEMLALRKAFPNELSGIYGAEEMAQATTVKSSPEPRPLASNRASALPSDEEDDATDRISDAKSKDEVRELWAEFKQKGLLTDHVGAALMARVGEFDREAAEGAEKPGGGDTGPESGKPGNEPALKVKKEDEKDADVLPGWEPLTTEGDES